MTRFRSFAKPCPYVKTDGLLLNHTEGNEIVSYIATLTRERDVERAVVEAALAWLNATGAEASARADAKLASATYDYRAAVATTLSEAP